MTIYGVTACSVIRVGDEVRWSRNDESKFSSTDATIKLVADAIQATVADLVRASGGLPSIRHPLPEQFMPMLGRVKGWELPLPGDEKGSQGDFASEEIFPMVTKGLQEAGEVIDVIRGVGNEVYRHKRGVGLVRVSHIDGREISDSGGSVSRPLAGSGVDIFKIESPLADKLVSQLMKRHSVKMAISLEDHVQEFTTPEGKSELVAESDCYERLAWVLATDITQGSATLGFLDRQGEVVEASCRVSARHLGQIEQHGGRIFKVQIRALRRQGSEVGQAPLYYILEEAEIASDSEAMAVQETADQSRQLYLSAPQD